MGSGRAQTFILTLQATVKAANQMQQTEVSALMQRLEALLLPSCSQNKRSCTGQERLDILQGQLDMATDLTTDYIRAMKQVPPLLERQ